MSNVLAQRIADVIEIAAKDEVNNMEVLKRELINNDFKMCGLGVEMMVREMGDMGLSADAVEYWIALGLTHLPYYPWEAIEIN